MLCLPRKSTSLSLSLSPLLRPFFEIFSLVPPTRIKRYHFVRLMGRSASHISLECALQTRPNLLFVGEEVEAKQMTLEEVAGQLAVNVNVITRTAIEELARHVYVLSLISQIHTLTHEFSLGLFSLFSSYSFSCLVLYTHRI